MKSPKALAGTLLLGTVTVAGRAVTEGSGAPLPDVYGPEGACVNVPVSVGDELGTGSLEWCVDAVAVASNGDLEVRASWSSTFGSLGWIERAGDARNRNMYLEDDRGRRYDHYETTEGARYGGKLEFLGRLQGTYFFRAQAPGSSRFTFHDDDQGLVIPFALDATPRVSPEERAALTDELRNADELEIEDSWGGFGPARQQQWRLKRTDSGRTGDKEVSAQVMKEFFDLLTQAPLTRGVRGARAARAEPPTEIEDGSGATTNESGTRRRCPPSWARLIHRVYQADPLVCRRCGGKLKITGYLCDSFAIRRMLEEMGLAPREDKPPPVPTPPREVARVPVDEEGREFTLRSAP